MKSKIKIKPKLNRLATVLPLLFKRIGKDERMGSVNDTSWIRTRRLPKRHYITCQATFLIVLMITRHHGIKNSNSGL